MLQNSEFGGNRAVTKVTFFLKPKQFFSLSGLGLQGKDLNFIRGTPSPFAKNSASWSKSDSNEGHFTLETERV
jgi:hypothetical protein